MTVDVSAIATAIIAGAFSILAVVIPIILQKYLTDKQASATLSTAIQNALGAIEQAIVTGAKPPVIAGVAPNVAVGVQYVQDHAGKEADRFKLSPQLIADKINARRGLHSLEVRDRMLLSTVNNVVPIPRI